MVVFGESAILVALAILLEEYTRWRREDPVDVAPIWMINFNITNKNRYRDIFIFFRCVNEKLKCIKQMSNNRIVVKKCKKNVLKNVMFLCLLLSTMWSVVVLLLSFLSFYHPSGLLGLSSPSSNCSLRKFCVFECLLNDFMLIFIEKCK